jgi:phosphopentomutase
LESLRESDILMITADHGNDPTTPGTDHSRERVPILIAGKSVRKNVNLGTRTSFSDVAATIGEILQIEWRGAGTSFVKEILAEQLEIS